MLRNLSRIGKTLFTSASVKVATTRGATQLLMQATPATRPYNVPAKLGARSRWLIKIPLYDAPNRPTAKVNMANVQ